MNNYETNQGNIPVTPANLPVTADDLAVAPAVQPTIDADELTIAEQEAEATTGEYKHIFKKPVGYDSIIVNEMTFDWSSLTGQDSLDIENELQALGKMVVVPTFSGEYLIRMAARASNPRVGADFFMRLPLGEYNKIRSAARSFLLKSE